MINLRKGVKMNWSEKPENTKTCLCVPQRSTSNVGFLKIKAKDFVIIIGESAINLLTQTSRTETGVCLFVITQLTP